MLLRLRMSPYAYAYRTCKHPCAYACAYACIIHVNQALGLGEGVNTHCLESQAECSNASSGQPTFSLNKSTCFLNCDMASKGADA